MKRFLFVLICSASLTPLSSAAAEDAQMERFQMPSRGASLCAPQGSFLDYFDRLPGKHFAGFGGVNRRSLLKRKGAVVDYRNRFIEIPGSADPANGDLYLLQVKLIPNGNEPWVAVSRVVWAQNRTPGTLNFYYGYNDAGGLREASRDFFPYKLQPYRGTFENAYLRRQGSTIAIRLPETDTGGPNFTYKYRPQGRSGWVKSETPSN